MKSMKSRLLASIAALIVSAGAVQAQTAPAQPAAPPAKPVVVSFSPGHLTVAKEVALGSGITRSYDGLLAQIVTAMQQSSAKTPEVTAPVNQILQDLKPELEKLKEQMVDSTAKVFASKMSEQDLQAVAAFFKTPAGQIYVRQQPEILDRLMPVINEWTEKTREYVRIRTRAELTNRGITVSIARTDTSEQPPAVKAPPKTEEEAKREAAFEADKAKFDAAKKALTPAQMVDAKSVALGSGITRSYDGLIAQVVLGARDSGARDPAVIGSPEFLQELDNVLKDMQPELDKMKDQIVDETAQVFGVMIPEADMKKIAEFFKTPAGLAYVKEQPLVLDTLMPEMERWTQRVAEYVNIRTRAELAKRGHVFR